ncbi:hypothetical protein JG688_00002462 [Phytophthora aleatoria]|uniref:Uncharacterized protein n=1 Tax=Phytophthora aleatoria TaxID=2496075 RepID=A0A8J5MHT1_9STRA|nr:hypothetical protein JG688_00002462 [Phytophthora aleatoria]
MSIFGGSERFPIEQARSPGPIYAKPDVRANAQVVMKADYRPVDESRKWGKRESWIGGCPSPQMPVISKVNMTAAGHQRELMAAESPGTATPERTRATPPEDTALHTPNNNASGKNGGNVFGHEQRFGKRQIEPPKRHTPAAGNTRVQFVSATHTRENMGEFSPGPIYAPYNPERSGGRLAPSPKSCRRPQPPGSPAGPKDPHANPSSRSSWLAGAVRKCDGQETVLLRTGDVPPGPGSYAEPPSSFASFSHNAKARAKGIRSLTMASRPSPRQTGATSARSLRPRQQPLSPRKGSATTRPAEPTWTDDEP